MRARHRHFNPGHAGASMVLDSRFVHGLSNSDPVSVWDDRSGNGNSATQSGTARPLFSANSINGLPAIVFDAVNDILTANPLQSRTVLSVTKSSTSSGVRAVYRNNREIDSPIIHRFDGSNFRSYAISNVNAGQVFDSQSSTTPTDPLICSSVFNDSLCEQFINSLARNSDAGTWFDKTLQSSVIGGTVGFSEWFNGSIACIVVFTYPIEKTIRRRLEHASGFSFKIPCS